MVDSNPNRKIRKRNDVTGSTYAVTSNSNGTPGKEYGYSYTNQQTTISEGHLWPPVTDEERKRNIGGAFETTRYFTDARPGGLTGQYTQSGNTKSISGQAIYPGDMPVLAARPSNAQLDAWGTTAISRVEPTKAVADMSVFLGELFREGLPSLIGVQSWKGRTEKARSAGSEYLNFQFGWVPLVSETRQLAHAVKNAERILKQYERDAGRLVRRRYDFPSEKTTSVGGSTSNGIPLTAENVFGGSQFVRQTDTIRHDIWFSGAFLYWIPKNDVLYRELRKYVEHADKLLGLELTPETLWNLAPWSWAIDWFTNVGDVLHNVSSFHPDSLVMRYGYIMSHQRHDRVRSWGSLAIQGGGVGGGSWRAVAYRKVRRPATPYGFGVNLGSLTNYQWSILAALGLTKGPRLL